CLLLGRYSVSGLRSRAEAVIDAAPPLGRGELEMRHLMQEHVGLGIAAYAVAVPAEIRRRRTGPQVQAEAREDAQGVVVVQGRRHGAGDLFEDRPCAAIEGCGEAVERGW